MLNGNSLLLALRGNVFCLSCSKEKKAKYRLGYESHGGNDNSCDEGRINKTGATNL